MTFILRWILNSFGLWVAVRIFGTGYSEVQISAGAPAFLIAGLIFSVVNAVLKPIVIILSLLEFGIDGLSIEFGKLYSKQFA